MLLNGCWSLMLADMMPNIIAVLKSKNRITSNTNTSKKTLYFLLAAAAFVLSAFELIPYHHIHKAKIDADVAKNNKLLKTNICFKLFISSDAHVSGSSGTDDKVELTKMRRPHACP